jgi:hypothetical protein
MEKFLENERTHEGTIFIIDIYIFRWYVQACVQMVGLFFEQSNGEKRRGIHARSSELL